MRVLLDTNILLRSAQPNHPVFSQATHAVAKLMRDGHLLFVCPQNIAEFWNVATRPAELNGLGFSQAEVVREIVSIENLFPVIPDVPAIYGAWKAIVRDHQVQGVKVYDARLVAIMTVHGIDSVLTFNSADFGRYSSISAILPSSLK
jgi:predicted nucleic acid-binding protein